MPIQRINTGRLREKQTGSVGMRDLIFILLLSENLQIAIHARSYLRGSLKQSGATVHAPTNATPIKNKVTVAGSGMVAMSLMENFACARTSSVSALEMVTVPMRVA